MATETTGLEFKRFYSDPDFWPQEADIYHDDILLNVDGRSVGDGDDLAEIPETAIVRFECGWVGCIPEEVLNGAVDDMSLEDYFKLWRHRRNRTSMASLLVECPNDLADTLTALIEKTGGTVTRVALS